MALQWAQIGFSGAERREIGGATLVFDTELIAVNGKTSAGATTAKSDDSEL
ncbi:hypothetical protein ACQJBY_029283 [Aegilops geniculata]